VKPLRVLLILLAIAALGVVLFIDAARSQNVTRLPPVGMTFHYSGDITVCTFEAALLAALWKLDGGSHVRLVDYGCENKRGGSNMQITRIIADMPGVWWDGRMWRVVVFEAIVQDVGTTFSFFSLQVEGAL
jgi:hypothetical protein